MQRNNNDQNNTNSREAEIEKILREKHEAEAKAAETKQKKRTLIIVSASAISLILLALILYFSVIKPKNIYDHAIQLLAAGQYDDATEVFRALGAYSDAEQQAKECQYQKGIERMTVADYDTAYAAFSSIPGYKNVDDLIMNDTNIHNANLAQYEVGKNISLGSYEQDNDLSNGKEPILWRVIKNDGNSAMLISEYGLEFMQFNSQQPYRDSFLWKDCSLRQWLNNSFFDSAFTEKEKEIIIPQHDPEDFVFLLNEAEVNKYMSTKEEREMQCSQYLIAKIGDGVFPQSSYECMSWWLRDISYGRNTGFVAQRVSKGGYMHADVGLVKYWGTIRPAIVVRLPYHS